MIVEPNYALLYSTSDTLLLNLIRSRLNREFIETRVHDEHVSTIYPLPGLAARIFVPVSKLAESRLILDEILDSIKTRRYDDDYRDIDEEGIEYEKQVTLWEADMQRFSWEKLITFLIIALIVSFFILVSL